ncbi:hypothetical protein [Vibrio vulnificus]|uniref:hypothetical protein n=1 Tax=Vibrio vulnificus TaxID=672 RepID=UPI001A17F47E|nr:hypothetical protein [Vibrio vulnificus]HAS6087740.1 hypothetical protein [Vibrio vulnificus]
MTSITPVNPATERKRRERERKRNAGMQEKCVTLSQSRQAQLDEVLDYMGIANFQTLVMLLLDAQYQKVVAHKQRHQCCGKCGDPYQPSGSCVFEGDYRCQYSRNSQRNKELKP